MIRKFFWAVSFSLCGLFFINGCAIDRPLNVHVDSQVKVPQRRVILFLVDGMRADLTQQMIEQGELPNIKKYLYDRGCHVENGVSVVPSITYAAISSIVTGCYPGHHDVMGNKWFDRVSGKYQNYMHIRSYQMVDQEIHATTLYEALDDKYTVTIQTAHRRGAARPYDNWMSSGINYFFHLYEENDRLIAKRFEQISRCAAQNGRWPDFILAYFPGVDEIGHGYGANSKQYRHALINIDAQIGRICGAMESNGILDDYYLMLVSDHGHDPMRQECRWQPKDYFQKKLKVPLIYKWYNDQGNSCQWHKYLKDYRVVLINGGTRRFHLHLRCSDSWVDEPSYEQVRHFLRDYYPQALDATGGKDLIDALADQEAIELVVARVGANAVLVKDKQCQAMITRRIETDGTKVYSYQPMTGDPLKYSEHPATASLLGSGFYDAKTWLDASCRSTYPNFVSAVMEMFDSHRAGQIVGFAGEGWNFDHKNLGGHGSIIREDMIVPFMISGPKIPPGSTLCTARLVDVMPTVLDMLGHLDRLEKINPIDGQSLLPKLIKRPAATQPVTTQAVR